MHKKDQRVICQRKEEEQVSETQENQETSNPVPTSERDCKKPLAGLKHMIPFIGFSCAAPMAIFLRSTVANHWLHQRKSASESKASWPAWQSWRCQPGVWQLLQRKGKQVCPSLGRGWGERKIWVSLKCTLQSSPALGSFDVTQTIIPACDKG